jgi:hypothetical protein
MLFTAHSRTISKSSPFVLVLPWRLSRQGCATAVVLIPALLRLLGGIPLQGRADTDTKRLRSHKVRNTFLFPSFCEHNPLALNLPRTHATTPLTCSFSRSVLSRQVSLSLCLFRSWCAHTRLRYLLFFKQLQHQKRDHQFLTCADCCVACKCSSLLAYVTACT